MKKIGIVTYILLIGLTFMQAGASLFAIVVNISILIESPPASLITAQGPYAFNPDIFWEKFPSLVLLTLVLTLIFNWKSSLRKWVLSGGLVWILSGVVGFVLLSPTQTEFLSTEFSNAIDLELKELGKSWRNFSLLFMVLSASSGFIYLTGVFKHYKEL
ncbi:hypothetical protein [Algoriphagus pacificus]|uniref:DUF1772 domain-containing protein n=1 Tax=Algoriphagus pacificus TaxID=2811234 RepID=A0ABS3CMU2_9BACT|nr:hypothetical protein [Algoriphagus pacificus]MBN7816969.1 hypothetical protein [Algoriphagus pacificus]